LATYTATFRTNSLTLLGGVEREMHEGMPADAAQCNRLPYGSYNSGMFRPQYRYTHSVVENLLLTEGARAAIDLLRLSDADSRELRGEARKMQLDASKHLDGQPAHGYPSALTQAGAASRAAPDEKTMLSLAGALLGGGSAAYRSTSKMLYNAARTELIYLPPETHEVPTLVRDLLDWLAESWESRPGVISAGAVHQELLLIQPFDEYNDAFARLAGQMVLTRRGYGLGGYSAPDIAIARHPDDYQATSRTSHSGVHSSQADFTAWLEYYSGQVAEAAAQAREAVLSRSKPTTAAQAVTSELPVILRDRQLRAMLHIRENGAIRSGEYQRLVGIVPDTARRDFDELMDKGLIEVRGVGRGTHYVLTRSGVEEVQRRRPA
jgi:hypothetical protein